jgi:hypothetical protein
MYVKQALMEIWVKSASLKGSHIVLCGSCVSDEAIAEITVGDVPNVILTVCLESIHQNIVCSKVSTIIKAIQPKFISILTVDGSPHCLELHSLAERAKFITNTSIPFRHFVIMGDRVLPVSSETTVLSRYLHVLEDIITKDPRVKKTLKKCSLEQQDITRRNGARGGCE